MKVYLDNAATTPLAPEVLEAMMPYLAEHYGNPSSIHGYGRHTRAAIEKARKAVAQAINASTGEVFFTSGGTESNNMVLRCATHDLGVTDIITSPIEHHCVLHSAEDLAKRGKVKLHLVNLQPNGHVDYDHLADLLANTTGKTLVSLMYANNEIGNLLDVDRVAAMCEAHDALFHSDTVQAICHYPIDMQQTKVHFLSGSAHKFHGPKGIGFLYINSDAKLNPFITGGSQERNMRAGTENLYGIIGMGKAIALGQENMAAHRAHIEDLRSYLIEQLTAAIPGISFNGDYDGDCLYTVLSVSFPPSDKASMMLFNLDIAGIAASGGSACSSGSDAGSHVMQHLGVDPERVNIRFSFSYQNTREEIDYTVAQIKAMYPVPVA